LAATILLSHSVLSHFFFLSVVPSPQLRSKGVQCFIRILQAREVESDRLQLGSTRLRTSLASGKSFPKSIFALKITGVTVSVDQRIIKLLTLTSAIALPCWEWSIHRWKKFYRFW
jgi:hypothetical protein